MCLPSAWIVLWNHCEVVGHDLSGVLAAEDAAGAAVLRLGAVAVLVAVVDLALVAVHRLAGDAAEEDARVERLAVDEHLELQGEVGVAGPRFRAARGRP